MTQFLTTPRWIGRIVGFWNAWRILSDQPIARKPWARIRLAWIMARI